MKKKTKISIIERPYGDKLYPRVTYPVCRCNMFHNNMELCLSPKLKYLSYKIQFYKWLEERMRGQVVREYKNDVFHRAYFKIGLPFLIFNKFRLLFL